MLEKPDGLVFPDDRQPNIEIILKLLADIQVLKAELEIYLAGHHPYAEHWHDIVPVHAR